MEDIYNIPFDEWYERIIISAEIHTKSNEELWDFWKSIEACLPQKYKLLLLLNCIYVENDNMTDEWLTYLSDLIINESDEAKIIRREQNMKLLDAVYYMDGIELVNEDGYIEIYRGIHSSSDNWLGQYNASRDLDHGLSYTYNKLIAEWFAIRTQADDCNVISAKVHIDDVLSINLDRQESEIIIIPPSLGGKLINIEVEKIIPDISIMNEFNKLRVS